MSRLACTFRGVVGEYCGKSFKFELEQDEKSISIQSISLQNMVGEALNRTFRSSNCVTFYFIKECLKIVEVISLYDK